MGKFDGAGTICWDCARATGQCPWSSKGQKIKGWTAIPTEIKHTQTKSSKSYIVKKCPGFIRDAKNRGTVRITEEEFRKLYPNWPR